MSRSGYSEDLDNWSLIRWRGAVTSAINGKRGQAMLKELLTALDAMPVKKLVAHELKTESGEVCALGCLGLARGLDMSTIDPDEPDYVADAFGVSQALVREIVSENDESFCWLASDPEDRKKRRWEAMRRWAAERIKA